MLDSTVAKSQSLSLVRDGAAQKVSDIPAGSTCTVTETGVSSAVGISYTPNASVVVNKNDAKSVTITNDYVNVLAAIVKQPNFTG
jgi:hypothetical protein